MKNKNEVQQVVVKDDLRQHRKSIYILLILVKEENGQLI